MIKDDNLGLNQTIRKIQNYAFFQDFAGFKAGLVG